ncbi:MAG: hypothetical protein JST58_15680 [Bacteroidetes bacterium]|nr:hypothetical protein [Bacteroidota bacterium]
MRQHFKSILFAQSLLLATTVIFANSNHNLSSTSNEDTISTNKKTAGNALLSERMVSFHAAFQGRTVSLHWNLAGEKQTGHFNVERSFDGEHFVKVGEIGASNTSSEYNYFDDIKLSVMRKNDLYYRLQQVDGDENSYSKVLIVRMYQTHSVSSISVTPDPTINDIQVNVQLKENSYVVMKINDSNGDEVMKRFEKAGEGTNIYNLEGTSKLKPGNYKLDIIVNSNEKMTMQLIKS